MVRIDHGVVGRLSVKVDRERCKGPIEVRIAMLRELIGAFVETGRVVLWLTFGLSHVALPHIHHISHQVLHAQWIHNTLQITSNQD